VLLSSDKIPAIVLPSGGTVNISIQIKNPEDVKELKAFFQRSTVLGASTDLPGALVESKFIETLPGIFSTELQVPDITDKYNLIVQLKTFSGNFMVRSIPFAFYISKPITIIDMHNKPVEAATVSISRYEDASHSYKSFDTSFSYVNRTGYDGIINVVLPAGKYKFKVSAFGYETKEIETDIGINNFTYPQIQLTSSFSFIDTLRYYYLAVTEIVTAFFYHLGNFSSSAIALAATIIFLALHDMAALFVLFLTSRTQKFRRDKFIPWFLYTIALGAVCMTSVMNLFFFLSFTFYQGITESYTLGIYLLVNIVIATKAVKIAWKEYKKKIQR
jgi:hypothetical protein